MAILLFGFVALVGCAKHSPNTPQPVDIDRRELVPTPAPAAKAQSKAVPKRQLEEPHDAIDPKSVEAAGQVVQHYGALIELNRTAEADKLWSDAQAAKAFSDKLRPSTHLQIGDLGPAEGAAGSIYTTVPVEFYVDTFRQRADIILRRVNDVPGSTEAQRRWHIQRIELGKQP